MLSTFRIGKSITVALLPFAPRKRHLSRSERRHLYPRRSLVSIRGVGTAAGRRAEDDGSALRGGQGAAVWKGISSVDQNILAATVVPPVQVSVPESDGELRRSCA